MYRKLLSFALLVLMVVSVGCAQTSQAAQRPQKPEADSPDKVVEAFYTWYLEYAVFDPDTGMRGNPVVDGAYKDSPYLSAEFVQDVEETVASFEGQPGGGYDPLLLAQDVPDRVTVQPSEISGDEATVVAQFFWSYGDLAFERSVSLKQVDGAWKIAGVAVFESPATVAQNFYNLYIGSIRAGFASGEPRNFLADGSYKDLPYLSEGYIAEVEALLASFDKGGYDPFLQAQDIPERFSVEPAEISGDQASVIVHTMWNGGDLVRDLEVSLEKTEGAWLITGIAPVD